MNFNFWLFNGTLILEHGTGFHSRESAERALAESATKNGLPIHREPYFGRLIAGNWQGYVTETGTI